MENNLAAFEGNSASLSHDIINTNRNLVQLLSDCSE